MDVITETSLEALLQRATDYRNQNTDTAAIEAFCGIIRKESDAPQIASKLIASKIQSSEEWEALQGLIVLDICMKNCGPSFHSEIGKFRFLNEMIKLVSPKFLGSKTPAAVRAEVLKMMHGWTLNYPAEHKIKEAYDMLVKQGVIQKNYIPSESDSDSSVPPVTHKTNPLFQDEEKVKLLQKLLQSKNPHDLQAANRLIKTMVKEDERRVEIKSKRLSEVETVRNNARLLDEMLDSYKLSQSSEEEFDLIKELHQSCERLKQNIYRLVMDVKDNDDFLNHVLSVGDELDQVLDKYESVIIKQRNLGDSVLLGEDTNQISSLLDLSTPTEEFVPTITKKDINSGDILNQPILNTGLHSARMEVSPPFGSEPVVDKNKCNANSLESVFSSSSLQYVTADASLIQIFDHHQTSDNKRKESAGKDSKMNAFKELDILSETLLQECKMGSVSNEKNTKMPAKKIEIQSNTLNKLENTYLDKSIDTTAILSMEAMQADSSLASSQSKDNFDLTSTKNFESFADLFISLDDIKPSSVPPIKVIEDKNGISVTIHTTKSAVQEDVTTFVITTLSKNPFPITNYLFQAAVPKDCKLKLQPPSRSELPGHNPFLPPSAITQIMLIANPIKVNVTLKCMISYIMEGEIITEMGEVDQLPT